MNAFTKKVLSDYLSEVSPDNTFWFDAKPEEPEVVWIQCSHCGDYYKEGSYCAGDYDDYRYECEDDHDYVDDDYYHGFDNVYSVGPDNAFSLYETAILKAEYVLEQLLAMQDGDLLDGYILMLIDHFPVGHDESFEIKIQSFSGGYEQLYLVKAEHAIVHRLNGVGTIIPTEDVYDICVEQELRG